MATGTIRRLGTISFILACALLTGSAGAAELTAEQWGIVLNLSGKQRMLTQKMSKEFLLVAADVDADANRKQLAGTMDLFGKTLKGLRDGDSSLKLPATSNPRIVKQIDKVGGLWQEIKPFFATTAGGGTASPGDIAAVAEKNLPLLANMNKVVKQYEREAKAVLGDNALAVVINLAGRQRMLTQKMSKEFLLVYLGVVPDENSLNARETISLFDQTLKGLIDGDSNLELPGVTDPAIRAQLEKVKGLWADFQPVVSKAGTSGATFEKSDVETIANNNVPLLKNMNAAVKQFEASAKNVPAAAN